MKERGPSDILCEAVREKEGSVKGMRKWVQGLLLLGAVSAIFLRSAPVEAKLKVVATTEHFAAIAKIVGGDRVDVRFIAKGYMDPHEIQPKPAFAIILNRADLLLLSGQMLELGWLDEAMIRSNNKKILEGEPGYVDLSEGINLIPYSEHDLEDTPFFKLNFTQSGRKTGNHHFYTDPANGGPIAKVIADRFSDADPPNAPFYRANYQAFQKRLDQKVKEWDAMMAPYRGTKIVSYHRDWTYLAKRHGFEVIDYVEPRETIPPDASHVAALIKEMKEQQVKLVIIMTYHDRRISKEIADRAGATLLVLPSQVSADLGLGDYFQLFDRIYSELAEALKRIAPKGVQSSIQGGVR